MKRLRANQRLFLLGSVAVAALTGFSAPAAAGDEEGPLTLLGRIVLGTGTDKVAIDTPQAVTVLNQDDIDRSQASTPAEMFDTIPGVQAIGSERSGGLSFNIRGIGELSSSDESKIIVTIDGAPKFYEQYRMGSFFSGPELFKRVEVLRGPASSTLYGSGALGGVINFTTKDASDFLTDEKDTALRTRLSFDGNGGGKLVSGIYAHRFSDQFEVLAALNHRASGQYKDGSGTPIIGSDGASYSGLLKGTYRFGDDNAQSLRLSFSQWQNDLNDTQYSQTGTLGFGTIDRRTTDKTMTIAYENPGLGNPLLDLKVALSLSDTDVVQSDSKGTPFPSALFSNASYSYRTLSLKAENTFEISGGNWDNYLTVGTQISNQDRTLSSTTGPLAFHPQGSDRKIGIYIQGEFNLGERLTITPGARIDFTTLSPDAVIAGASEASFTTISPKVQAMYRINDAFSVFGSLAHTERAPTIDEMYSNNRGHIVSKGLGKEKANSVELGFAYQRDGVFHGDDVMSLKTTAFYSELSDVIVNNTAAGPTPDYVNGQDANIWGVELEAAYQSERMFGQLALSLVDGKTTGVRGVNSTQTSIPAPSLSLTLGGRAPDLGLEYGWTGNAVGGITTSAYDAATGLAVPTSYSGYATHDVFVDWKPQQGVLEGADLRFSVSNIFDKTYQNNLAGDNGRGRTFKVTLTKSF